MVSKIERAFSASVVIGFSVMTSQPSAIARLMYRWWVASTVATMTVSGRVSRIMASNCSAR